MARLSPVSRKRVVRLVAGALAVVATASAAPSVALAQGKEAKAHLVAGAKAARAKDWATALAEYQAAEKADPSATALEGVANAEYGLKDDAAAYEAYATLITDYGSKLPRGSKALAERRLKELGERTGVLTVQSSEAGAEVSIDGKVVGTAPLPKPVRVAAGPHRVRVSKPGFVPFDRAPSVPPGGGTTVDAKLEAESSKGRVSVKEKTGKAVRVIVDGVDVGPAPWSGEVEAGKHEIALRGPGLASAPQQIDVARGKASDVELEAASTTAPLKITTSDGKGLVYLDGKLVGEGSFTGDVPAGPHAIRVTREGYDPFEETIDLHANQPQSRSVTLALSSKIETGPVEKEARRLEGLYGGFGLLGTFMPGGEHSSMQKLCDAGDKPQELTSCSGQGGDLGAGLDGFIGYHWDPVGVELFAGAQYDTSSPTLTWAASSLDLGVGPDPARTEEFTVRRLGGFGIARVRLTLQGEKIRFSVAGGVGLSYRTMALERDTKLAANQDVRDVFAPSAQSYLSPVLSLEPSVQYRLSPSTALALGLSMLVESPRAFDQIPTTSPDGGRSLGPSGLSTPAYDLATGTQVFLGPFVGMMFGP